MAVAGPPTLSPSSFTVLTDNKTKLTRFPHYRSGPPRRDSSLILPGVVESCVKSLHTVNNEIESCVKTKRKTVLLKVGMLTF